MVSSHAPMVKAIPVPFEVRRISCTDWGINLSKLVGQNIVYLPIEPSELKDWFDICDIAVLSFKKDAKVINEFRNVLVETTYPPTPVISTPLIGKELQDAIAKEVDTKLKTIIERIDKLEINFDNLSTNVKTIDLKLQKIEQSHNIDPTKPISSLPKPLTIDNDFHQAVEDLDVRSITSEDEQSVHIPLDQNVKVFENPSNITIIPRLEQLTTKFDTISSFLDRIDNKVDRLDSKVDRYDTKVDQNSVKTENLVQQATTNQLLSEEVKHQVHALKTKSQGLEEQLLAHKADTASISALEKDIAALQVITATQDKALDDLQYTESHLDYVEEKLLNLIRQVNIRELNRVLMRKPRFWAEPVPNLEGEINLPNTFNFGYWALCDPLSKIKAMSMEEVDRWLDFYGIGEHHQGFEFLENYCKQVKQAILLSFIGGISANPSDFKEVTVD